MKFERIIRKTSSERSPSKKLSRLSSPMKMFKKKCGVCNRPNGSNIQEEDYVIGGSVKSSKHNDLLISY
jgi:hypothetical protein